MFAFYLGSMIYFAECLLIARGCLQSFSVTEYSSGHLHTRVFQSLSPNLMAWFAFPPTMGHGYLYFYKLTNTVNYNYLASFMLICQ